MEITAIIDGSYRYLLRRVWDVNNPQITFIMLNPKGYPIASLSTFRDIPWNSPFYWKLGFHVLDESELTAGFQQIRLQKAEAGLPIADRVIMQCELG
ncbi:hypothetical protein BV372_18135 [Nostoc sp. T09]|uniref:DUF1643 domain-containing protein n=1 Tax=Nostoc sp. T09 TaxID=1932621 RepID=UPI000A37F535|nr:DUF1643 domain-containing protein [Nostoc sp. T09]OUL32873.1 hypothetical protein BV372_18135 [Nostoc sp. T09]